MVQLSPSPVWSPDQILAYGIKAIKYLIGRKKTKTVSYHLNLHSVWPPVHPPPLPSPCHSKLNLIIWRAYILPGDVHIYW